MKQGRIIQSIRDYLWLVPFAYGIPVLTASAARLISGTPFDRDTYERAALWDASLLAFLASCQMLTRGRFFRKTSTPSGAS
ncbi:MAG: hypothetical protein JXA20_16755 [Spirochaetes bacterium]|nr:hypothetical protein [Spirochaetota bacterium]